MSALSFHTRDIGAPARIASIAALRSQGMTLEIADPTTTIISPVAKLARWGR